MIELSVIRDLVAIFGVIAGFTYYVLTVKANQKSQKHQQETRQVQFLIEFNQQKIQTMVTDFNEIMKAEWTDYEDWFSKYRIFCSIISTSQPDKI